MRPTIRRNYIVATIFIAVVCNYLDRQLLSILKPEILTHFGVGDAEYAVIVNVFLICYAIMYPVGGILVDRFGPQKVMFTGILTWSLACVGGGLSQNIVQFAICRGILGLSEPVIFAGLIVVITVWYEKTKRALANSLCQFGGSIGAMIAPAVIAWMSHFFPWYLVFIFAGCVGIVIAGVWLLVYRTPPQEILDMTTAPDPDEAQRRDTWSFSWGQLWKTSSLWGCLLIRLVSDPVWYFCSFWLPGFLRGMGADQGLSHRQTLDMIQYIGGIPFLVGAIGGVLASAFSDKLVRRGMPSLKARKISMISMVVFAPLCVLIPFVSTWGDVSFSTRIALVVIIFSLVAAMCQSWLYTIVVIISESFPVKNVSSVLGIACGAGAVGGAIFNEVVGSLINSMGDVVFFIMASLHIIAALILWKMVKREPKPATV
ncbi:MAG: MFS transporter [Prevotellaceae bacterium]|nr:MFS transporter [Prevotellaceae bacterium]MDY3855497.1 MFS transporter [Bacteroidaceae bacterium]